MHLRTIALVLLALVTAVPAYAGEGRDNTSAPTATELATMILKGNDAEHALVVAWLEKADRSELVAVFAALRVQRTAMEDSAVYKVTGLEETPPERAQPTSYGIQIATHIIDVPHEAAAALLGELRPKGERMWMTISAASSQKLLEKIASDSSSTIMASPRTTVYDGQLCNVSVVNQISYVKDFEIETTLGGQQIANPVIANLKEGLTLDMRPVLNKQKDGVTMSFLGRDATVARPIPVVEIQTKGEPLKVQRPEVSMTQTKIDGIKVANDGWVLLDGRESVKKSDGSMHARVVLAHVEVLELEGERALEPTNFAAPELGESKQPAPTIKK